MYNDEYKVQELSQGLDLCHTHANSNLLKTGGAHLQCVCNQGAKVCKVSNENGWSFKIHKHVSQTNRQMNPLHH